jgi:hypothetical protein
VSLFIKYKPSDTGVRSPSPCGGSDPVWLASSIRLTLDDVVNTPISKARVGVTCRIHVDVHSQTKTYTPSDDPAETDLKILVQAWVCRPTAGGVGPGSALASSPTDILPILQTVSPGVAGTRFFTWTPEAADVPGGGADETHLCIGANCFWTNASGDPLRPSAEGAELIAPAVIDICNNPHHAQRNIALLSATAPGSFVAEFVAGGLRVGGAVELELIEVRRRRELVLVEKEFLVAEGIAELLDGRKPVLAGAKEMPITMGARAAARAELRGKRKTGPRIRFNVKRGELVPIKINVRLPEDKPGTARAFDVVQRGPRGEVVGALRFLTVAPG